MSILMERMSVRKYTGQPVTKEQIINILRAAMQAPSAHNQRPWEFYVVTDRETIEKLSTVSPYAGPAKGAAAVIVAAKKMDSPVPESIDIDMAACIENIWLAAVEQGLGGVWIGIAPLEERMAKVEEILNLPDSVSAFALFAVGYPAEEKEVHSRFNEERVHYVD